MKNFPSTEEPDCDASSVYLEGEEDVVVKETKVNRRGDGPVDVDEVSLFSLTSREEDDTGGDVYVSPARNQIFDYELVSLQDLVVSPLACMHSGPVDVDEVSISTHEEEICIVDSRSHKVNDGKHKAANKHVDDFPTATKSYKQDETATARTAPLSHHTPSSPTFSRRPRAFTPVKETDVETAKSTFRPPLFIQFCATDVDSETAWLVEL